MNSMKYCILFPLVIIFSSVFSDSTSIELKVLGPDDTPKISGGEGKSANVALVDGGHGNYGDLIYRYRENGDTLILREVVVLPHVSSEVRDVQWYASTNSNRISTVRVLNFGQERAETYRIDVAAGDVQALFRVPSLYDPRIMIEVYGL